MSEKRRDPLPRGRRVRRWTGAVVGVAAVVGLLFAGKWFAEEWLRGEIERVAARQLSSTVEVAQLRWLPWWGVKLRGVRVAARGDAEPLGSLESFQIGELSVYFSGLPDRSFPVELESIAARRVMLRMRRPPAGDGQSGGEPVRIPDLSEYGTVRRLQLSEARVVYDPGTGEVEVPLVFDLERGESDGKDVYGLTFRFGSAEAPLLTAQGQLAAAGPRVELEDVSASVDRDDPAERVLPGFPTGSLSGSAMLDLSEGRTGRLRIDGGRLNLDESGPAFEDVHAELVLRESMVEVRALSARYGGDEIELSQATLDASDPRRVRNLEGFVTFPEGQRPVYPEPLGGVIRALAPGGRFDLSGSVPLGGDVPFRLELRASDARLAPAGLPVDFAEVRGRAVVTRKRVVFDGGSEERERVSARSLEGTVHVEGVYDLDTERLEVDVKAEDITIAAVVAALRPADTRGSEGAGEAEPAGVGDVFARVVSHLSGEAASIEADGNFDLYEASFFEVPVLSPILELVPAVGDPLGAGQAAGLFRISGGTVHLERVTVWGPAVGLHGSGDVGFDGALEAEVTVAPLGDWSRQLEELEIPVLGTVVSTLAGTLQSVTQTATSELLYAFNVTGTVRDPEISAIPVPTLTQGMGRALALLLQSDKDTDTTDRDLLEKLKQPRDPEDPEEPEDPGVREDEGS